MSSLQQICELVKKFEDANPDRNLRGEFVGLIGNDQVHNVYIARAEFRKVLTASGKLDYFDSILSKVPCLPVDEISKLGYFMGNEMVGMIDDLDHRFGQRIIEMDKTCIAKQEMSYKDFHLDHGLKSYSFNNVVWEHTWIYCSMIGIPTDQMNTVPTNIRCKSLFGMFGDVKQMERFKNNKHFDEKRPVLCFLVLRQKAVDSSIQTARSPYNRKDTPLTDFLKMQIIEEKHFNLMITARRD